MRFPFGTAWRAFKAAAWPNLPRLAGALAVLAIPCFFIRDWFLPDEADQHGLMRWRSAQAPVDLSVPRIPNLAVYSVPNIKPPHARPTLRDLGDQAQAQAIKAMQRTTGANAHPWDDLRKALTDAEEPGEKDPYLFERVLVATVGRGDAWLPGDRVVRTEIRVKPINFVFAAYSIAATENKSVKVSSVEATDSRKMPSDIGLAVPGLGEMKVNGLPGNERSVKATSEVNSEFEQLGVDITPSGLQITRESGLGGDVVGNTRVALSVTTDALKILDRGVRGAKEFKGDATGRQGRDRIVLAVTGLNLEASEPTMDVVPLVPLPHCALMAKVGATFIQRHILRGRQYYDEAMQDVEFLRDEAVEKRVPIAGADDVSPFVWSIQLVPPGERPDN